MNDDVTEQEQLAAAGYTSRRGAVLFCTLLGGVGALFGSVVIAILWNFAMPEHQDLATVVGTASGALVGVLLALVKIDRGNREAREEVEDKVWRREMLRNVGKPRS